VFRNSKPSQGQPRILKVVAGILTITVTYKVFGDFDGKRCNIIGVCAHEALKSTRQIVVFRLTDQLQKIYAQESNKFRLTCKNAFIIIIIMFFLPSVDVFPREFKN